MSHAPVPMAAGNLAVKVVTPEGALWKGEASFVAAPASDGEVGVLPSHTPLISRLGTGLLRVTAADGRDVKFAVRGGFLQVVENSVTLLVAEAVGPEQTDAHALQKELEETLARLQRPESDDSYAALLAQRRWIEARQKLA